MNGRRSVALTALALLTLGCGTRVAATAPPASYLRATPIVEHGAPGVEPSSERGAEAESAGERGASDFLDEPVSEDERPRASPASGGPTVRAAVQSPPRSATAIIAEANALASQAPESESFLNAVMQYTFVPGGIYKVFTAPENVTDLALEPGEEIMGEPAAGDILRWRLGVGTSAVAGVPQTHVFIKPTRAGLSTNLTLNTNRRTYFLRLESVETDCMIAVQWNYPQSRETPSAMTGPLPAQPPAAPAPRGADVSALNFDYSIDVTDGDPLWTPRAVYDDGSKTYIRFESSMLHGESPALFVVERDEMQIVNYRVKGNLYIVDRLFRVAELRLGQDDQDVVRLVNRAASKRRAPPSAAVDTVGP